MNMLINIDNFRIHTTAMINSGFSMTILSIHIIPTELCNHVKKSTIKVKGILVTVSPVAELVCDITVGEKDSPSFDRVHILVSMTDIPTLLGQDILSNHIVKSYTVENSQKQMKIARIISSTGVTHTAPITSAAQREITYTGMEHEASIKNNNGITATGLNTLPEKLAWLMHKLGIDLPIHLNQSELEQIVNLIIGTDVVSKGIFINPVKY